jgi:hypothetical protein
MSADNVLDASRIKQLAKARVRASAFRRCRQLRLGLLSAELILLLPEAPSTS